MRLQDGAVLRKVHALQFLGTGASFSAEIYIISR
jgi:hypothetical protein